MTGIHVTSEIGNLRKVCVHRPGDELLNLPPDSLDRLLFNDIPFLDVAQQEHDAFADMLRSQGVEVVYLENLVAETFDMSPKFRAQFLDRYVAEASIKGDQMAKEVRAYLDSFEDNLALVKKTMAGITRSELDLPRTYPYTTLQDMVNEHFNRDSVLVVDPMPNLCFIRDPFACIGESVTVNRMHSPIRNRESLYMEHLFSCHPDFVNTPQLLSRTDPYSIEGGDVLNLTRKSLAIGVSQRTEPAAIDHIARNVFWNTEGSEIERIFAFEIPPYSEFTHLDTVFTQIDVDKYTVHPAILGSMRVYEMSKGSRPGEVRIKRHVDALERILEYATGVDGIKLIPCGGQDRLASVREQWNDGTNTLCIKPGTICVYQRNKVTNDLLYKEGLELLVVPSAELSRGRGGPRCMSAALQRADVL
ncbi:arginine deiminase [Slackia heliotrinireducens]|uniref:arginine deiminase n=1 Tax=Slackia heliotrinireducens TaxID=84110 RepID=UPI003314B89F